MRTRRTFLAGLAGLPLAARPSHGWILVHEHILVDFIGADQITPGRYNPEEVIRVVLPHLQELAGLGCRPLLDCTPNFLGRDPQLLMRLARAAGLEIWTNTGLYSARDHQHLPAFAKSETPEQLAARWIREHREGIDGVKPRFIKIGVNKGPLDELDRKIVQAAVIAAKATGLTIAAHTGDGKAALEELEIVQQGGLPTRQFVWVHAQNEVEREIQHRVARAGAWVELDGIGKPTARWHLTCIESLAKQRLLHRVLISQDAGWYSVGQPQGGSFRTYSYLWREFVPQLKPAWVRPLLWNNPVAAFGK
jgi:phosphotriesterase-related protein